MSSEAPVPLPRARQQFPTSSVDINVTSARPTATRRQSLMTSERFTPTSATSQSGATSQSTSQGADVGRMLDGN